jgi:hypothetical protein
MTEFKPEGIARPFIERAIAKELAEVVGEADKLPFSRDLGERAQEEPPEPSVTRHTIPRRSIRGPGESARSRLVGLWPIPSLPAR